MGDSFLAAVRLATRLVARDFLPPDLLAAAFLAGGFRARGFFIYDTDEDPLNENSQPFYLGTVP